MALTATTVKQALPKQKDYWLSDEKGLRLLIKSNGAKYWRLKYRFLNKQKTLALGVYPAISLKSARSGRDEARQLIAQGIDPGLRRKTTKEHSLLSQENSFEAIAREWFQKECGRWSPAHQKKQLWLLESNLFPYLSKQPISEITPPELLRALRKTEARGALETTRRAKQVAGQIFRYAVATGRADRDPSADLKGALKTPKTTHFATTTDPKEVGRLLIAFEGYKGSEVVRIALNLAPLLFVRPGELRHMEWKELDLESREWRIPASKMKMNQAHLVPLSEQAYKLISEIRRYTGKSTYVFPSERSWTRPMSENTLNGAIRRLGISKEELTAHGFRAMARTLLDEELGFQPHIIEHQLAHEVRDPLGRAYNRTSHLPERQSMMQKWADYLDILKAQQSSSNILRAKFQAS